MKTIVLFLSFIMTLSVAASPSYSVTETTVSVFMDDEGPEHKVASVDLRTGDVYSFTKNYDFNTTVLLYESDYSIVIQTISVDYTYLYVTKKHPMTDVIRKLYRKSKYSQEDNPLLRYKGLLIEGETRSL